MYVLDGGPRAGQLVDDLPEGYAPPEQASLAAVVIGDIPASLAVWHPPAPVARPRLRRVE